MVMLAKLRTQTFIGALSLMLSVPSAFSAEAPSSEPATPVEQISAAASTATTATTTTPMSTAPSMLDLATTFGSLILVVGLILVLAWFLKRMKLPALGQQKGMRIVTQLNIGTKERIAVIQVGEEQFLIGITPQSIQTLAKLEKPLEEQEQGNSAFANQFSQLMKKYDKG